VLTLLIVIYLVHDKHISSIGRPEREQPFTAVKRNNITGWTSGSVLCKPLPKDFACSNDNTVLQNNTAMLQNKTTRSTVLINIPHAASLLDPDQTKMITLCDLSCYVDELCHSQYSSSQTLMHGECCTDLAHIWHWQTTGTIHWL